MYLSTTSLENVVNNQEIWPIYVGANKLQTAVKSASLLTISTHKCSTIFVCSTILVLLSSVYTIISTNQKRRDPHYVGALLLFQRRYKIPYNYYDNLFVIATIFPLLPIATTDKYSFLLTNILTHWKRLYVWGRLFELNLRFLTDKSWTCLNYSWTCPNHTLNATALSISLTQPHKKTTLKELCDLTIYLYISSKLY